MDTAQWPQESGEMEIKSNNMDQDHDHQMGSNARSAMEKRARPQEQLNCPRCNSTNTKFCYYNNYSLTQPRYFCKTCRRYWTEGGTLRNVPVGGGSRKNKKSSSVSTTPSSSGSISSSKNNNNNNNNSINIPDLNPPSLFSSSSHQNPRNGHHEGRDLNLTFNAMEHHYPQNAGSGGASASSAAPLSAMELLRTGIASRGVNSFIPTQNMADHPNALYSTTSSTAGGFSLQEFKPANLGFCLDGLGNRYGEDHENMNNGGRILFPFGDHLKPISSASGHHQQVLDHQNKGQGNPNGYWNGLIGGGSW